MKALLATGIFALLLSVAGCQNHASSDPGLQAGSKVTHSDLDQWLGRWDGPEGTFLQLSKREGTYMVLIQDLDGPKTFEGVEDSSRIRFVRKGKTEYISASNGEASGMKWLVDKKNCLMTRPGEGWCRN